MTADENFDEYTIEFDNIHKSDQRFAGQQQGHTVTAPPHHISTLKDEIF